MRVTWKEFITIPDTYYDDLAKEGNYTDTEVTHAGEVIGTTNGFFCGTMLVVGCDDGKIREIHRSKVTIVKDAAIKK